MSGQQQAPAVFNLRERDGAPFTGGCVVQTAGLDGGNIRPTGIPSPDTPARILSLYVLSYPAHACR